MNNTETAAGLGNAKQRHYISARQKLALFRQLSAAAEIYEENLRGKQFLIISRASQFGQRENAVDVGFEARHFMHLVGCESNGTINAERFFESCLSHKVSLEDFEMYTEAVKKLRVIPMLFRFVTAANMIGNYNGSGNMLSTGKIAGKTTGCMGFIKEAGSPYMVPNTTLEEDIRKLTTSPEQILAIYCKKIGDPLYPSKPAYVCKQLKSKSDNLKWPKEIQVRISGKAPED